MDIKKILEAAKEGSRVLDKYFGQNLEIEQKSSPMDVRTMADLGSEEKIVKVLEKNFPNYNINSEERGFIDKGSDYTFFVDPLDGTSNFIMGIPNFSLSIGLFLKERAVASVVAEPVLSHFYWAQAGQGAFLNKRRIKVNGQKDIQEASIAYDCNYGHYLEEGLQRLMGKLEEKNIKRFLVNMSPALDLCRLAAGRLEAYINNGNEIYDFAAGKLILKEAGGMVTDFRGNSEIDEKNNIFLASNGTALHHKVLGLLQAF